VLGANKPKLACGNIYLAYIKLKLKTSSSSLPKTALILIIVCLFERIVRKVAKIKLYHRFSVTAHARIGLFANSDEAIRNRTPVAHTKVA